MNESTPRLELRGISKRFGPTQALDQVSLSVRAGEVHALIGENGAGKSTLMKILAGVEQADEGEMHVDGAVYAPRSPSAGRQRGVAMIHQELAIAKDLSVEANVMLGMEQSRGGFLARAGNRQMARAALQRLGRSHLDLDTPAGSLGIAEQQLIEIARALAASARVIIFDEPTSSLGAQDVENLFALIAELAAQGIAIVYISHFLEEVARLCERFSVLRDGRLVATGALRDVSTDTLIKHMVGRDLETMFPRVPHALGEPILEVAAMSGAVLPTDVSFLVRRGEIFGLAGLVGSGRSEVLRCLYGLTARHGGSVRLLPHGATTSDPAASIAQGIGFVSEDRKDEGLFLDLSLADNLCATRLQPFARAGWLSLGARDRTVRERLVEVHCNTSDPRQTARALSGGNQQKVALARLLHQDAELLLLDEPTRGIDVGTKAEIYRLIGQLAARGRAIIVVSSYLPELMNLCDTLGVMCRGRLVAVKPIDAWSQEEVMRLAVGA